MCPPLSVVTNTRCSLLSATKNGIHAGFTTGSSSEFINMEGTEMKGKSCTEEAFW